MERKRNVSSRNTRRRQEENAKKETIYLQSCITSVLVLAVILMGFFETNFTNDMQERISSAIRTQIPIEEVYEITQKSISVFKNGIKKKEETKIDEIKEDDEQSQNDEQKQNNELDENISTDNEKNSN